MLIGITQIILRQSTLDETLDLCQEAGYQCVELVFQPGKDLDPAMSNAELRGVGERCAVAGVEVTSLITTLSERGNLLSSDPVERDQCLACLTRSLEIAGVMGVGATLLHPGQLTVAGTYEQAWELVVGALRDMAPLATRHRCVIALENVWNKFLLSPREARSMVEEVGSEWIGWYLDTANMMAYGYPEHWIRSLGPAIKRVHFKDFKRREHAFVPLMDGDTDWPVVMRELRGAGYTGPVVHEVGGDRALQMEMAQRMRRILSAI